MINVAIIILNYNNAADTIACIESLLSSSSLGYKLIIVDNHSTDNAGDQLRAYLKGFNYQDLGKNGCHTSLQFLNFIETDRNLGFSGGNNIGIRYALADPSIQFVWVLNNDTVVHPEAPRVINQYLSSSTARVGVIATLLVYEYQRNRIQALGGTYRKWMGKTSLLYPNLPVDQLTTSHLSTVLSKADYLIGASLIFRRSMLDDCGLFSEDYFLYCEEIDIIKRARTKNWKLGFIQNAIVYHKEGGTTGATTNDKIRYSSFIEYQNCRSKLIFTRKFYWYYLPLVFLFMVGNVLSKYKLNLSRYVNLLRLIFKTPARA